MGSQRRLVKSFFQKLVSFFRKDKTPKANEFAQSLGADIYIAPQDDGAYICSCGRKLYSAAALYMHRKFDHVT